jgi:hypothetical protein
MYKKIKVSQVIVGIDVGNDTLSSLFLYYNLILTVHYVGSFLV